LSENENTDDTEKESKINNEKSQSKYVFECQKCGECCESRESIVVSLEDLKRWNKDMTLPSLFPFLTLELLDNDSLQLSLKKPDPEDGKPQNGCPLYDETNKICNIYFSMPLFCSSYPLGYDGKHFFIKDGSCPGLGKGKMTPESLKSAREVAISDFEARVSTTMLLPLIQGLSLKFALDQSRKEMEKLTPEQKEKLSEVFGKGFEKDL
jgi:Fe-S-cluster containining protein